VIVSRIGILSCVAALSAGLSLIGCSSSSDGRAAPGKAGSSALNDQAGGEPLPGVVAIRRVDRAPDGGVRYAIQNISGKDQEDLAYFISFFYESQLGTAIETVGDRETTLERDIDLLRGAEKEIAAANPRPGKKPLGTELTVRESPPVAAVARSGGVRGTGSTFMNRELECVGMATEDEVRAGSLWLDVENVGTKAVTDLEAKAVFVDSGTAQRIAETKWRPVGDVLPGRGPTRVKFDISELGRVSHLTMLVKIRQVRTE
jgi:hypothetical protein